MCRQEEWRFPPLDVEKLGLVYAVAFESPPVAWTNIVKEKFRVFWLTAHASNSCAAIEKVFRVFVSVREKYVTLNSMK